MGKYLSVLLLLVLFFNFNKELVIHLKAYIRRKSIVLGLQQR